MFGAATFRFCIQYPGFQALFFLMGLQLLFTGCGNSSLSSGPVVDPSQLRVNVNLSYSTNYDGEKHTQLEAFIQDKKGRAVANSQILVKVNGVALRLNNGSSNYYGAYPHYQLIDSSVAITPNGKYAITIILTDGTQYELGVIQTQAAISPTHFLPPAVHSRRQPLTLRWQELDVPNWLVRQWKQWTGEAGKTELKISKVRKSVDQWGNTLFEQSGIQEADFLATTMDTDNGAYTIPVAYLKSASEPFNGLEIVLISDKNQGVNRAFREGSAISSHHSEMFRIDLTD